MVAAVTIEADVPSLVKQSRKDLSDIFADLSSLFLLSFAVLCELYRSVRSLYRLNLLTPNDPYSGRTASLTSKLCILYIYSTNIGTEYFKHDIHSPFFSLQNVFCFIIQICLVPVLLTFYI